MKTKAASMAAIAIVCAMGPPSQMASEHTYMPPEHPVTASVARSCHGSGEQGAG